MAMMPLAERHRLAEQVEPFRELLWRGDDAETPMLHIDDFSAIPFLVDISGVEEYQHRARLRARKGDFYAAVTPPTPGYEKYCGRMLGLEPVEMISATQVDPPLALSKACCEGKARARLIEIAKSGKGLTIQPFMGAEKAWELAAIVASESEKNVTVLAPPPPVTWLANDKATFSEIVAQLLGTDWLVEGHLAAGVDELVSALVALAGRYDRVALKRLRCASAMGNSVFESVVIRKQSIKEVTAEVASFLERTEWRGDEGVFAVAWEKSEHSPSTQLWIPPQQRGPVRLDGVYEQLLAGRRGVFVGSRPSTLPQAVNDSLAESSLRVASALQALGYIGRCSFDFILGGDPEGDFQLKFTECNGRWGGTSTPMALLDRLLPQGRPPYRARDFVYPGLVGAAFTDVLDLVGEEVWNHQSRKGRYLFYNTGPLRASGKLDVIALGTTQSEADDALEEKLPKMLGL